MKSKKDVQKVEKPNIDFRVLLATVNKKENDENTLKFYSMDFSNFKNQWIEHYTNLPKNPGNYRKRWCKSQTLINIQSIPGKLGVYNGILLYLTYEHKSSKIGYINIQSNPHNMSNEFAFLDIINSEAITSNTNCIHPKKCEHPFNSEFDVKLHILSGYEK